MSFHMVLQRLQFGKETGTEVALELLPEVSSPHMPGQT